MGRYRVGATLIERWNATSWSVVGSPNRAGDNSLLGVTCLSATSCFAVGTVDAGSSSSTLVERWSEPLGGSFQRRPLSWIKLCRAFRA
jgi:hypothetical protein